MPSLSGPSSSSSSSSSDIWKSFHSSKSVRIWEEERGMKWRKDSCTNIFKRPDQFIKNNNRSKAWQARMHNAILLVLACHCLMTSHPFQQLIRLNRLRTNAEWVGLKLNLNECKLLSKNSNKNILKLARKLLKMYVEEFVLLGATVAKDEMTLKTFF